MQVLEGEKVQLSWPDETGGGGTLTLTQGDESVSINAAGDASSVTIPGDVSESALMGLQPGDATYRVEVGGETVHEGSVQLSDRFTLFYQTVIATPLSLDGLPLQADVGQSVVVQANSGSNGVRSKVYVGTPSNPVELVELAADSTLPANEDFSFEYTFSEAGTYVVEINYGNGLPAANVPVYVGDALPILVPAFDIPPTNPLSEPLDGASIRSEMLEWVNALRAESGVSALVAHPLAEETAQTKAQQMADNQFFGHSSSDGKVQKFKDLAVAAGLSGQISENIVVQDSVERAYGFLYWSPSHRRTMLDDRWASMGTGAAMFNASYNQVAFTQHFTSSTP
jgi:uncharacterized protein YkwD